MRKITRNEIIVNFMLELFELTRDTYSCSSARAPPFYNRIYIYNYCIPFCIRTYLLSFNENVYDDTNQ